MRKKFITKILLFIFVFIFISLFFSSPLALPAPQYARAAGADPLEQPLQAAKNAIVDTATDFNPTKSLHEEIIPKVSVPIGDFMRECNMCAEKGTVAERQACYQKYSLDPSKCFTSGHPQNWLGQYIIAWFNYLVGAIGIIAVVMVMWGGIKWITAGGNASQVDDAKGKIKNAVIGIVLLLCTYTIFKTINPRLLSLQLPTIDRVAPIEYCCRNKTDTSILKIKYDEECDDTTETTLTLDDCKKSGEAIKAVCPSGSTGIYIHEQYISGVGNVSGVIIPDEKVATFGESECKKNNKEYVTATKVIYAGKCVICYTCK